MKIAFYCEANSPSHNFIPPDVDGRGLGGAEFSLVSLARALAQDGADVEVYNATESSNFYDGVMYANVREFKSEYPYDAFILYRNPSRVLYSLGAKRVLWWSLDQMTTGHFGLDILPFVHHIIVISEYHRQFHHSEYGVPLERMTALDLGVRLEDYGRSVQKVPGRLLYCSVPDRGLAHLLSIFPKIKFFVPEAELYITSDYSLWGPGVPAGNSEYRRAFEGVNGVHFLGKVPREVLVQLQLSSDLMAYPNQPVHNNSELFCIAAAECQVAGCVPITSRHGALETTVGVGVKLDGYPFEGDYQMDFVQKTVELLSNRNGLRAVQAKAREYGIRRFNWRNIARQWLALLESIPAVLPL